MVAIQTSRVHAADPERIKTFPIVVYQNKDLAKSSYIQQKLQIISSIEHETQERNSTQLERS